MRYLHVGTPGRPCVQSLHRNRLCHLPLLPLNRTHPLNSMTIASQATDLLSSVGILSSDGSLPPPALDLDTLVRASVMFVVACILYSLPVFLHRIKLTAMGMAYLLLCNDKSWKKPQDPGAIFEPILTNLTTKAEIEKKTLVFVRQ